MSQVTQSDVVGAFNKLVFRLMEQIKQIEKDNPDPLMATVKTHRLIKKWFSHSGNI